MRAVHLAVCAAAILALAGCGKKSDAAQVESTIRTYYTAFANGDSAKACDQLSDATRASLEKRAGGRKCADLLSAASQRPNVQKVEPGLKNPKITNVKVTGNTATATATVRGTSTTVPLKKENGHWRIAILSGG
jgi:hypothetical protein